MELLEIPMTTDSVKRLDGGGGGGSSRAANVRHSISRGAGRPSDPYYPSLIPAGSSRTTSLRRPRHPAGAGAGAWWLSGRRSGSRLSCPPMLALFLLTLMACRPCHGHDPELFDIEDEDGKILFSFFSQNVNFPTHLSVSLSLSFFFVYYVAEQPNSNSHNTHHSIIHLIFPRLSHPNTKPTLTLVIPLLVVVVGCS